MSHTTLPKHVIIIGGGLAGPCLALSLAKHNIKSTIFELRPTRSTSGGSISLGPSALKVLDQYAGIYPQLKNEGHTYEQMGAYSEDGEHFGVIKIGNNGYPAIRIMRARVQDLLMDECERVGNGIDVKWGMKLESIEENNEGVTARFEDGTTSTGDILIGADGVHSAVRSMIYPASPKASFAGMYITSGFLPRSSAITPPTNPSFTFPSFNFTPCGLFMTIPINPSGSTLAWGINVASKSRSREEWKRFEESGDACREAKAGFANVHAEPTRSVLDSAVEKDAKIYTPFVCPKLEKWSKGGVCLVGDAAHSMPPNGLGSALAFEDTALLTRLLITPPTTAQPPIASTDNLISTTQVKTYQDLFEVYQSIREPRVEALRGGGVQGLKNKSGPWVWWLKKWAFRAFFWWNRGVIVRTQETNWDADKIELGW